MEVSGHRLIERPRLVWRDVIQTDTNMTGVQREVTQARRNWENVNSMLRLQISKGSNERHCLDLLVTHILFHHILSCTSLQSRDLSHSLCIFINLIMSLSKTSIIFKKSCFRVIVSVVCEIMDRTKIYLLSSFLRTNSF